LNIPKPLLPVAGKPILDYIFEKLEAFNPPLTKIVLSTNMRFQPQFQEWLAKSPYRNVELVPDDAASESQKPGAIKAMAAIICASEEDDVFVIAGDGMFKDDLTCMLQMFRGKKASVVALYQVTDLEVVKRSAIAVADKNGKIIKLIEKPANPQTTTVCGAVYIFKKGIKKRLEQYLGSNLPLDQPGCFIEWLYRQEPVYGYMLKDTLRDIGTIETYKDVDKFF
jgi:glucose-1-phosphate thymidylyltransferase